MKNRADLPFEYRSYNGKIIISTISLSSKEVGLKENDVLLKINEFPVKKIPHIEFALNYKKPGDLISLKILRNQQEKEFYVESSRYYSNLSILVFFSVGIVLWIFGIFIFLMKPEEKPAEIIFFNLLCFSSTIMISATNLGTIPFPWVDLILRVIFLITYSLTPAIFLHFSFIFPKEKAFKNKLLLYIPGILFVLNFQLFFLHAFFKKSIFYFYNFHYPFPYFRFYVVLFTMIGIFNFIRTFIKSTSGEEKDKIRWILWGIVFSVAPFILLWMIPKAILDSPIIKEEVAEFFFILIPVSFLISIVKYKLFDIELIIKKSLIYSSLTFSVIILYFTLIEIIQYLFNLEALKKINLIRIMVILIIAALFNPIREKIQNLIDRMFYRIPFDYRKIVREFTAEMHKSLSMQDLVSVLLMKINRALFIEGASVYIYDSNSKKYRKVRSIGTHKSFEDNFHFEFSGSRILAIKGRAEEIEELDFSKEKEIEKAGFEILAQFPFTHKELRGVIGLGRKKSEKLYSKKDLEFILTISEEASIGIERLKLQEEVILERLEKEKLEEINRLKSEFVSTVSHELRSPMTSIRGFAEMLQIGKKIDKEKRDEYLDIIIEESERLSRLIENILDISKIEEGVKKYYFDKLNLKDLIERTLSSMEFQFKKSGFKINKNISEKIPLINGDCDALTQVLINLLNNSIKYSSDRKEITVNLKENKDYLIVEIEDKGIGIPEDKLDKIFDKYYRIEDEEFKKVKGLGLGLSVVRHIIEAHNGDIKVESKVGIGTKFSVYLPKQ
ncbi:MAG: ATP-binding protein [Acidobacteriota bacterium]